jgi:hypothetical protein
MIPWSFLFSSVISRVLTHDTCIFLSSFVPFLAFHYLFLLYYISPSPSFTHTHYILETIPADLAMVATVFKSVKTPAITV